MWRSWVGIGCCVLSSTASAANQAYQNFFFAACVAPTGALATRCAQTPGGTGNLSGDSESSLNPGQLLSRGDGGIAAVRATGEQSRDRAERAHEGSKPKDAVSVGPFSLLINGRGTFEEADRNVDDGNGRGYESEAWAAELGFDYRANERLVIGVLAVTETADTDFDQDLPGVNFVPQNNPGEFNVDRLGATVFAAFDTTEASYLEVSFGYIESETDVTRNPVFQESGRTVPQTNVRTSANNVDGSDTFASMHWGYVATSDAWTYGGYLGVFYAKSEMDGYRENDLDGSGLALNVDSYERTSVVGTVGLRVGHGYSFGGGALLPEFRVEYGHEFDDDGQTAFSSLVLDSGNNVYALEGTGPDTDYFNVGAGLVFLLTNGWMPFIDTQVMLGVDDIEQWRVTAGLRKEL